MSSGLDRGPHVLILEVESILEASKRLLEEAKLTLREIGATCEVIGVKRVEDLVIAASFAAHSGYFNAIVILAVASAFPCDGNFDSGTLTWQEKLVGLGIQRLAMEEKVSISCSFVSDQAEFEEVERKGREAIHSAMRLFAIQARFDSRLNEV